MKRDVLIPYKNMGTNELEYAIRSIEKNVPHRNIHVLEHVKDFSEQMPVTNPFIDVENKLYDAMKNLDLTEEFVLWNDDFFVLDHFDDFVPVHRGRLKDVMDLRKNDSYKTALKHTHDFLVQNGVNDPLCYDLHIPMVFNTEKRLKYSEICRPHFKDGKKLLMRSVYGNLERLNSYFIPDCKDVDYFRELPLLSTSNKAWNGPIGEYIRETIR